MGKRDRERRERGDFIAKPQEPKPFGGLPVANSKAEHELFLFFDIPHVWAMRRPLPPEEKGEQDGKAGSDVEA